MVIRNRILRRIVSILGSTLIGLAGIAFLGIVVPRFFLIWLHSGDTWDGPPGEGLFLVFSTVIATIFAIFPIIVLAARFYRKLSP